MMIRAISVEWAQVEYFHICPSEIRLQRQNNEIESKC